MGCEGGGAGVSRVGFAGVSRVGFAGVAGVGFFGVPGVSGAVAAWGAGRTVVQDGADGRIGVVGLLGAVDVGLEVNRRGDGDGGAHAAFGGVDTGRDLRGGI